MKFNEVTYGDVVPVDGYGPGFFRVEGEVHEGPLALLPSGRITWKGFDDLAPLITAAGDIDVLFVGVGQDIAALPEGVREALEAENIGVELMATPTACRTYNVLLSEGRRIGLAVLPV
ncbi:Mth938-like domain-containing protein [Falsihalocynthiibacter sp. SS001]|uniref:Mth938-like domain-containing protein n=1 Tax=Falsihalocynthiibacter sp. SS001 TaxID=3349698 RepID=UPI0036D27DAC